MNKNKQSIERLIRDEWVEFAAAQLAEEFQKLEDKVKHLEIELKNFRKPVL